VIVSLVRFTSGLSDAQAQERFEARADAYREVPGLVEKIYLRYRETGELGAVYVWESEDDLERFRQSDLGSTIQTTYQVEGAPGFEVADVALVVRPRERAAATAQS
jgi:heme-degrading monooxygenase HmoA